MQKREVLRNFVVIEGIDGSGTTTLLKQLGERYRKKHTSSWLTCEPTDGEVGALIRRVLSGNIAVEPQALAHLFVADRYQHLYAREYGITDRLARGELVVCDRYLFSSLAYQSVECGFDFVDELNRAFPLPQFLIFLDVSVEVGERRASNRQTREIFENLSFQKKVVSLYEKALETYARSGVKIMRIDGAASPEIVAEKVWSHVSGLPMV
ncbi:MAG: dTMP kinase [Spirochaetales bacterium]|nr:dTMP kinase [Spirochaetales bacterium]